MAASLSFSAFILACVVLLFDGSTDRGGWVVGSCVEESNPNPNPTHLHAPTDSHANHRGVGVHQFLSKTVPVGRRHREGRKAGAPSQDSFLLGLLGHVMQGSPRRVRRGPHRPPPLSSLGGFLQRRGVSFARKLCVWMCGCCWVIVGSVSRGVGGSRNTAGSNGRRVARSMAAAHPIRITPRIIDRTAKKGGTAGHGRRLSRCGEGGAATRRPDTVSLVRARPPRPPPCLPLWLGGPRGRHRYLSKMQLARNRSQAAKFKVAATHQPPARKGEGGCGPRGALGKKDRGANGGFSLPLLFVGACAHPFHYLGRNCPHNGQPTRYFARASTRPPTPSRGSMRSIAFLCSSFVDAFILCHDFYPISKPN